MTLGEAEQSELLKKLCHIMTQEITIKIVFAREGGEVSASAVGAPLGAVEILPPEAPRETEMGQIPPPPTLEEAVSGSELVAIPPPPSVAESEAGEYEPPLPPDMDKTHTGKASPKR